MDIPKIIHYCWFGKSPLPELAQKCISSWKRYFPDYEIKEWNEDNFDVNMIKYTKQAYEKKKYAFVSDYARFWILYNYGGIYFDTDVEVLKDFTPILKKGSFMGCERDSMISVNPGLGISVAPGLGIAAEPGLEIYNSILEHYKKADFLFSNGEINTETVVMKTTRILKDYGLKEEIGIQNVGDITVYPKIYFCPDDTARQTGIYDENTYSAHHYMASWMDKRHIKRSKNPFWKAFSSLSVMISKIFKKVLGDKKWENFRNKYLKKLYNFLRGI